MRSAPDCKTSRQVLGRFAFFSGPMPRAASQPAGPKIREADAELPRLQDQSAGASWIRRFFGVEVLFAFPLSAQPGARRLGLGQETKV